MNRPLRSTSNAPAPRPPSFGMGVLFSLRQSGARWPFGCRAALSVGLPVAVGWAAGDISAGLTATIGAFTSMYATDRPYLNRARILAGIALWFSVIVSLGVWVQQWPASALPLILVIAMGATFLCHSLRIGPPGAYMFALVCAAGTAMPVSVDRIGWLVLGGGMVSWVVHMCGALFVPRGPEKAAVAAAAHAVAQYAQAIGTQMQDPTRHEAALALHHAWTTLVTFQPASPRTDDALSYLRALNRELHLIFATCVDAGDSTAGNVATLGERAREIGVQATSAGENQVSHTNLSPVPLGRPPVWQLLRDNLKVRSPASMVTARVGIAVVATGLVNAAFGLERAYWAIATAVLMLYQGLDWVRTMQRGLERAIGTFVGLVLAGAIIATHPTGLWLLATMMGLQFLIEILITRNYALAVVFITSSALVIASGGRPISDPGTLLWARGIDTSIGCSLALLVYALLGPRGSVGSLRERMVQTLTAMQTALDHAGAGDVNTDAALRVRRDLQDSLFALLTSYETEAGGIARYREAAERLWPAVVATERLGYKVLAGFWSLEASEGDVNIAAVRSHLTADERVAVKIALADVIAAVRQGTGPIELHRLPPQLRDELLDLGASLVADEH
jgi:uncharacterized membrane protein YccC